MTDFTGAVAPALPSSSASSPAIDGSSRSSDGCWPTASPRWGCSTRCARTGPARSSSSRAEQGRNWSRYSFIGVRCAAMLTERDGTAAWLGRAPRGVPEGGSAVEALRDTVGAAAHTTAAGAAAPDRRPGRLPHLRRRARLGAHPRRQPRRARHPRRRLPAGHRPRRPRPRRRLDPADRQCHQLRRIGRARRRGVAATPCARLDRMQEDLSTAGLSASPRTTRPPQIEVHASTPKDEYLAQVEARQGVHPQRRRLPGRALAALLRAMRGGRVRRLPHPAGDQPEPVHVPHPGARGRSRTSGRVAGGACPSASRSRSSGPRRRPSSRSRIGTASCTRSPAPAVAARPPRRMPR